MEIRGRDAEKRSAAVARVRRGLSLEGLGGRPRRAPARDRAAVLAAAVHHRRRGLEARRPVRPEAHRAGRGDPGGAAQRRGDRRRGDGGGRGRSGIVRRMTTDHARPMAVAVTRMVVGGRSVDAADGRTFQVVEPHRGAVVATSPLGGREDVDRAVDAAQAAFDGEWGSMAASDRGRLLLRFAQVVRDHEDELAALESRQIGKPISGARWEVGQVAKVLEFYGGATTKLRGSTIPVTRPGPRLHAARADRGRRAHRPLELPDHDGQLEGRARARRRQHRGPQARLLLPADGDPARRAGARGRAAGGRAERGHRPGPRGRRGDGVAPGDRQDRVHRRDRDRAADPARGVRDREEGQPRARRQEPQHRVRRRRHRGVRGRVAVRRVRQLRPGLLRPEPDPRRAVGPRARRRAVRRRDGARGRRATRRIPRPRSGRSSRSASASASRATSRAARPRARRSSPAASARRTRRWPTAPTCSPRCSTA